MDEQSQLIQQHLRAHALSRYSILTHFDIHEDIDILIKSMIQYDWEIISEHRDGTKQFRVGDFPNNIIKGFDTVSKGDLTAFRYMYLDTEYLAILDNTKQVVKH